MRMMKRRMWIRGTGGRWRMWRRLLRRNLKRGGRRIMRSCDKGFFIEGTKKAE